MKLIMEIRPGEGGEDARLLTNTQMKIYVNYCEKNNISVTLTDTSKGWLNLVLDGPDNLVRPLLSESGGHRWQRIPPTERNGRVHTSTVTVVVLKHKDKNSWCLKESDLELFTTRDSGRGGQHRNVTDSCVIIRHKPTGITAKSSDRCQHQNRRIAREILESRVQKHFEDLEFQKLSKERKDKAGSGMRGDKIRTYREQDDIVVDDRSGRKVSLKKIRAGKLEILF